MQFKKLAVLCASLAAAGAFAQTAATPDYSFAFNAAVTTDYRFRGLTQSRFDPALSAGVDFTHKSGFYIGAWASSIKWIKDLGGNADAEIDVYGGYRGAVGDFGYDLGLLRYQYPSHNFGVSPNTTELYGALTYSMFTAKYSHTVTNAFGFADSKNSGYLDLSAAFDLGSGWSIVPHIGHQHIDGSFAPGVGNSGQFSYSDYALTLNKDFGNGLVVSLAAVGTDAKKTFYTLPNGRFQGRDGATLTLKYNF